VSSNGSAGLRPRLIGFDKGQDPLYPGFVQVFHGAAKTGGESLFAPNPFSHPALGFPFFHAKHRSAGCPSNWTAWRFFLQKCQPPNLRNRLD
jgi:hypothetical protein